MKIKHLLFLFTAFFFLSTCNSSEGFDKKQILGSWRLSEVLAFDKENPEVDKLVLEMAKRELMADGLVLFFFPDSMFTELDGYSTSHKKWSFIGDKKIKYGQSTLTIEKIEQKKSKTFLTATLYDTKNKIHSEFKFVKESEPLEDYKSDPFYPTNNKWRQRPETKESNEEIRKRLLNYILHFAYILNATLERNENVVSFAHSMGLIQVFRGGIGRIPKNKIEESWINCFYDKEDAMKAFYLFSSYLRKGVYKGGTTGNWIKDDYEILMTLYYEIQKKSKGDEEQFMKAEQ